MGILIEFDTSSATAAAVQGTGLQVAVDEGPTFQVTNEGTATAATIEGGPRGLRGRPGVEVIAADQEFPPSGTEAGTIIYKRV